LKKFYDRKKRAERIVQRLKKIYPDKLNTALIHKNVWELLVSTILSAQCTDKRVNEVTKKLFKKYKEFEDYINAKKDGFETDIKSTGYYKNKTKNILSAAKVVKEKFGGKVPCTMNELLMIPGVGRKTANVMLSAGFGVVEGIVVDTHVRRFAVRFNLTDHKDPKKIENDLMKLISKKEWRDFSFNLVKYGQEICPARKHDCKNHPLTKIYPKANIIWPKAK